MGPICEQKPVRSKKNGVIETRVLLVFHPALNIHCKPASVRFSAARQLSFEESGLIPSSRDASLMHDKIFFFNFNVKYGRLALDAFANKIEVRANGGS